MKKLPVFLLSLFALLFSGGLAASTTPITGTVVDDDDGLPLIGVAVHLVGSTIGTVSDINGSFSLTVTSEKPTVQLKFSYTGFQSTTVKAKPGEDLGTIRLSSAATNLEEVVVVGYGVQRRRDVSGSIQGKVAGVALSGAYQSGHPPYERGKPEQYNAIEENGWINASEQSVSTLSTDVDRASYANVRRFIKEGSLPPADAVRSEEMINYFNYDDPAPTGQDPIALTTEIGRCPWNADNRLLRVGLRARDLPRSEFPPANLVFLIDVSGSMQGPDRLPLLKQSLMMLVDQLRPEDKLSIVVYAGAAGLVLPPTPGDRGSVIREALEQLSAGGSTAGGAGIQLAYQTALENFIPGGNNRVILATDGDFNVGTQDQNGLVKLIESKRESGVYLTVLGFGRGNYQGGTMQELADRGNGNHAYIDGVLEAKKTLIEEFGGTLVTVAKDVKVQLAFDPKQVAAYRLIGYENRLLDEEDFDDDTKDAGEMGAGHRVTVLYEIVPAGRGTGDLGQLRVRYKAPEGGYSRKMTQPVSAGPENPSNDLAWAAAVAEFAMLLRDSEYQGTANYTDCIARARAARGEDHKGYRAEMIGLMEQASGMAKK
ncbi:vWA domain-containing protein [Neolewinella xylanilytica]|uniref:vWA domain-containing protein n=1 Tax=Neolewinella xylanilytica TaxID=1514080 RepID=UPI001B8003F1|nr:VWA domain-containing protein [Neolewinella xylanilytica]